MNLQRLRDKPITPPVSQTTELPVVRETPQNRYLHLYQVRRVNGDVISQVHTHLNVLMIAYAWHLSYFCYVQYFHSSLFLDFFVEVPNLLIFHYILFCPVFNFVRDTDIKILI